MSSKGLDATIVSPYPVGTGGARSCGECVGWGCEAIEFALLALEVFLRFFG